MRGVWVVAVVACGPGLARVDSRQSFVDAAGDPVAIENMLHGSVTNGGLWFSNADCAMKFQQPGDIAPPDFRAFARCLAELRLQGSARTDALADVTVLSFAPGFEVEARVTNEQAGPRLRWIGFVAKRATDILPTVTPDLLETLRLTGDRHGPLDPQVASKLELQPTPRSRAQYTWIKLCIDDAGAVTSADPYETTSLEATVAFTASVRTWTFRPFMIQEQPLPVCSMVRLAYPPGEAPEPERLPLPPPPSRGKRRDPIVFAEGAKHKLIEGKRIRGEKNIVPHDRTKSAIQQSGVRRVMASFRVCIDETGVVESVLPFRSTGFAEYDRRLLAGIWQWAYSPFMVDDQPVPVCTAVTFIYTQR